MSPIPSSTAFTPARNIGWSSAIRTLTRSRITAIPCVRQFDDEGGSFSGRAFNQEPPAKAPDAIAKRCKSEAAFQTCPAICRRIEAPSVVLQVKNRQLVDIGERNVDPGRERVLGNVVQPFLRRPQEGDLHLRRLFARFADGLCLR